MPEIPEGFHQTDNRMGMAALHLDRLTESFVDYAAVCKAPVLDIGAGVGTAAIAALEKGATVIASDISASHLALLKQRVPGYCLERLTLVLESFPAETERPIAGLGAVLLARVLHFLTGPQIIKGLSQVYNWLRPGGKVFISISTPYQNAFQPLIPYYEERLQKGETWPGFFSDLRDYDIDIDTMPTQMHLFTPPVINRALTQIGFKIESSDYYPDRYFPALARLDGRETILVIAIK